MTVTLPFLSCRLDGRPRGQGSLKPIRVGDQIRNIHPADTVRYRNDLVLELRREHDGRPPHSGPVAAHLAAWYPRPAAHWLPANSRRHQPTVRPGAPQHCWVGHDLDKICRLAGDALQAAGVLLDDRQICQWDAWRRWSDSPQHPGSLWITVTVLP